MDAMAVFSDVVVLPMMRRFDFRHVTTFYAIYIDLIKDLKNKSFQVVCEFGFNPRNI